MRLSVEKIAVSLACCLAIILIPVAVYAQQQQQQPTHEQHRTADPGAVQNQDRNLQNQQNQQQNQRDTTQERTRARQDTQQQTATQPAAAQNETLPETAGSLPLLLLAGFASLAGAFGSRVRRQ